MKALMKLAPGPGHMELRDVPVPEIGEDDLLIEVKAVGICGSDIRMRNLGNSENLRAPVVLGHEFAGVIVKTGKNVKDFQVGERVVSDNTGDLCGLCDPVSYTHLDVYKRQPMEYPKGRRSGRSLLWRSNSACSTL